MQKKPTVQSSQILYDGYLSLREDQVLGRDGNALPFNVVETPGDAVCILAQTEEKSFVICSEYRHGIGEWVYSLPGGNLDEDEDPIEAGKRELLEEAGFEAPDFTELGVFYPCPAILNQQVHLLLAHEANRTALPALEEGEWIETHIVTEKELFELINDGSHIDGMLFAMLYYYRQIIQE